MCVNDDKYDSEGYFYKVLFANKTTRQVKIGHEQDIEGV
jgi:hypothetical protein